MSDITEDVSGQSQILAFFSALNDVIEKVVIPNKFVISDRFDSSLYAYQLSLNESLKDQFWYLREKLLQDNQPVYILLDVPPEVGFSRKNAQKELDHFERKGHDFHTKVRNGYADFSQKTKSVIIDATREFEVVYRDVKKILLQ